MSSSIFFKFKSQKQPSSIAFDGTSLSVFEVKREIITQNRLGDGTDFDLEIYTPDSNERRSPDTKRISREQQLTSTGYDDDTVQIARATTVIARRLPAAKPGAGRAARYVSGKMPVTAKNQHRVEASSTNGKSTAVRGAPVRTGQPMTEEEKLQDIFGENQAALSAAQADILAKGVNSKPYFNKAAPVPDKPLPPGYQCHRCGNKGHWIQACPTNNDPGFDGRPKFRKTTGIPRSFLKVVAKASEGEDGKVDTTQLPAGAMFTANGDWVIAEPDKAAWDRFQEKHQAATEKAKEVSTSNAELRERGLECSIDDRVFVDPVKTPCCGRTYCRHCIENALIDSDFVCPNCGENALLENLEPDEDTVAKIKAYQDERKQKDKEASKSPVAASTPKAESVSGDTKSPAPNGIPDIRVNGTTSANSTPQSAKSNPRKRSADEELGNTHKPSRPAAMKKKNSKEGTPAQSTTPQPAMPMPNNMADFVKQMNAMSGSMPGMQNGMPAFTNPMMAGMNPAMMNPMMNPMMMGMPGMMPGIVPGMMPNMGSFNGMNGMNGGMGFQNQNQFGGSNGMPPSGPRALQGQQQGFNNNIRSNTGTPNGNDGAYFRQPVNPGRHQARQKRQRSVDYKQM